MNKAAPSFGRIAAMVVFALSCFGLLLFLWLAFGGPIPLKPQGYRFQTSFAEATQLAKEADVRISGVPVGRVKTIEPDTETGRSIVVIELQSRYAPMPSDAQAILRQKTLLGETYVELTPGSRDAEPVAEGGSLPESQISDTVQLDEIYRTFDAETRAAFQTWMQEQARGIGGYGRDLNDALGNLGPFAEDSAVLVDILNRQEGAVTSLISNTGVVFEALTERDGQLRSLIENSNRVFQATASRDEELKEAFVALPTFERESAQTLERLAEFSVDTDPLITQLRPAARELSPTLQDLGALSPDLEALFRELNPLIDASVKGFPAAEKVLEDARPADRPARPGDAPARPDRRLHRPLQARADRLLRQHGGGHAGVRHQRASTTCARRTRSTPRTWPSIRAGSARNRPNAYTKPGNFNQLGQGLPVFDEPALRLRAARASRTCRCRRCRPRSRT